MKHSRKSKCVVAPTVKGEAATVLKDTIAFQRLLDIAGRVDAEEGIRQGLEDAKKGKIRPAMEFFAEFEAEHGLPQFQAAPPYRKFKA